MILSSSPGGRGESSGADSFVDVMSRAPQYSLRIRSKSTESVWVVSVAQSLRMGGKPVEPVPSRRDGSKTDGGVASVIWPLERAAGATGLYF